ncbi:hypothetical protein LEP1GSC192_3361 [Leptospira sp. B5-022]|nr:hypothetical protein LEP1GSC192_3361 [Leptospira sp. B5-022]
MNEPAIFRKKIRCVIPVRNKLLSRSENLFQPEIYALH